MKYIIDEEELIGLLEDRATLDRLECNGVDNWDGYEMYDKETGEMYFTYHNNNTNYCNGVIDLHKTYKGRDK